jgi:hypothetical protein
MRLPFPGGGAGVPAACSCTKVRLSAVRRYLHRQRDLDRVARLAVGHAECAVPAGRALYQGNDMDTVWVEAEDQQVAGLALGPGDMRGVLEDRVGVPVTVEPEAARAGSAAPLRHHGDEARAFGGERQSIGRITDRLRPDFRVVDLIVVRDPP